MHLTSIFYSDTMNQESWSQTISFALPRFAL